MDNNYCWYCGEVFDNASEVEAHEIECQFNPENEAYYEEDLNGESDEEDD